MTILHAQGQFWHDRRVIEGGQLKGWRCQECRRAKGLQHFRSLPGGSRRWSKRCRICEDRVAAQELKAARRQTQ